MKKLVTILLCCLGVSCTTIQPINTSKSYPIYSNDIIKLGPVYDVQDVKDALWLSGLPAANFPFRDGKYSSIDLGWLRQWRPSLPPYITDRTDCDDVALIAIVDANRANKEIKPTPAIFSVRITYLYKSGAHAVNLVLATDGNVYYYDAASGEITFLRDAKARHQIASITWFSHF